MGQYELSVRYALTGCRRYGDRIVPNPGVRQRIEELLGRNRRSGFRGDERQQLGQADGIIRRRLKTRILRFDPSTAILNAVWTLKNQMR